MLPKTIFGVWILVFAFQATGQVYSSNGYRPWHNGPPSDDHFFPIAVWLQSPDKAKQYLAAGFNSYVGLWGGHTETQLALLKSAGMKVICRQNAVGLKHLHDPTIIGWNHGDEPDNAQSLGHGHYGPPIPPAIIVEEYNQMRAADPSRPIMLNLGQGVAWDDWTGRGARTGHSEDYSEYIKGCDITSFDIYPVASSAPEIAGKPYLVAKGVDRLVKWAGPGRIVWNCIECTHIENSSKSATPQQVRAEVWMSLIHGSHGLIYFVHEWKPHFNASALLADPEMLSAVTAINRQIAQLAPVLNSPAIEDAASVTCVPGKIPVDIMKKQKEGAVYLFAVAMREGTTVATFTVKNLPGQRIVEVLGENRTLTAKNGVFADQFGPWAVHLYRIAE